MHSVCECCQTPSLERSVPCPLLASDVVATRGADEAHVLEVGGLFGQRAPEEVDLIIGKLADGEGHEVDVLEEDDRRHQVGVVHEGAVPEALFGQVEHPRAQGSRVDEDALHHAVHEPLHAGVLRDATCAAESDAGDELVVEACEDLADVGGLDHAASQFGDGPGPKSFGVGDGLVFLGLVLMAHAPYSATGGIGCVKSTGAIGNRAVDPRLAS